MAKPPGSATAAGSVPPAPLIPSQVASWRSQGFAFVSGLFEPELIAALREAAARTFPAADSPEAAAVTDFGSGGRLNFPSRCAPLNAVTLHPRLLAAAAQLLGCPETEIRLTQSDLWPKYGRAGVPSAALDNDDQRIHVDYPNHTLAHPTPWDRPEAVELILYLDDVTECGGATAVVPRSGPDDPAYRWPIVDTPGIAELDYVNDRESAEAYFAVQRPQLAEWRQSLYQRERRTWYRPGDVLLYRHDTWHRGTPLMAGRRRLVQNVTFRRAASEWISVLHVGWAWSAYARDKFLERLIAGASLTQRAVLGFPQPGSAYWCPETLAAVEARYGVFGMDMTPYREALL
ncbi:MAG: phytanoyl-CoA dioxygenase family protein [Pseudomonadales bacterium]